MAYVMLDFECEKCSNEWEELVQRGETINPCPSCGGVGHRVMSVPKIGAFSAMSPEFQQEALKKRSRDHSFKEIAKTPEKWGQAGINMAKKGKE